MLGVEGDAEAVGAGVAPTDRRDDDFLDVELAEVFFDEPAEVFEEFLRDVAMDDEEGVVGDVVALLLNVLDDGHEGLLLAGDFADRLHVAVLVDADDRLDAEGAAEEGRDAAHAARGLEELEIVGKEGDGKVLPRILDGFLHFVEACSLLIEGKGFLDDGFRKAGDGQGVDFLEPPGRELFLEVVDRDPHGVEGAAHRLGEVGVQDGRAFLGIGLEVLPVLLGREAARLGDEAAPKALEESVGLIVLELSFDIGKCRDAVDDDRHRDKSEIVFLRFGRLEVFVKVNE